MASRPDPEQIERDWVAAARVERDHQREPFLLRHPHCVVPTSAARGEPIPHRHPRCVVPVSTARGAFQASVIDSVNRAEAGTILVNCPACGAPASVSADGERELFTCTGCGTALIARRTLDGIEVVQGTPNAELSGVAT